MLTWTCPAHHAFPREPGEYGHNSGLLVRRQQVYRPLQERRSEMDRWLAVFNAAPWKASATQLPSEKETGRNRGRSGSVD